MNAIEEIKALLAKIDEYALDQDVTSALIICRETEAVTEALRKLLAAVEAGKEARRLEIVAAHAELEYELGRASYQCKADAGIAHAKAALKHDAALAALEAEKTEETEEAK